MASVCHGNMVTTVLFLISSNIPFIISIMSEILGSHSSECEDGSFLGCNAL
jgi:hypothetical protein